MFEMVLSDEERLIQETARRFAQTELLPALREHERGRRLPDELLKRFRDTGLDAIELPTEVGQETISSLARALVLEELAAVDPGAALALDGVGLARYALVEGGQTQILRSLERDPSARGAVVLDAEGEFSVSDGHVSGEHAWVPADSLSVLVVLRDSEALVVVRGLRLEPVRPCGLDAAGASRVILERAPVEVVLRDPQALRRALSRVRLSVASLLIGAARGAHEYSLRYAGERTAFGKPIAHHQALAFLIVDMATAVQTARMAVWQASAALDAGGESEWEAASALAEAAEQALFVGPNAVQILGGHGFVRDYPVEKWMRDIRTLAQLVGGRDEAELRAAELASNREIGLR